ncbi:GNAT family N-acetyltransferase [Acinetobacter sp. WZC-1]|uniref:GNAT family N-acetyltransferase n=1 Tax=Acinetobacter sp. WZC-1 TaxID=3459034 RepID=UPI00403DAA5C
MAIQIIPIATCSYTEWLTLWQAYLSFYQTALSEQQSLLNWQRLTSQEYPEMSGYMIRQDNQMVGFVHLISHASTWTTRPYCYLQDLFIDEKYRNQGLARKLIEHSYAVCSEHFDRVYWLTHESNLTAQLLYDRIADKTGFIQYKKILPP